MCREEMQTKIESCLEKIETNERVIIANDINERTIAHKFAEYLQLEFPEYSVDVEYNRNYERGEREPKYASFIKDGFREAFEKAEESGQEISGFFEQVTTYPDIIIHERMNNNKNLLIIEIKKNNNNADWTIDEKKLEAFTRKKERDGYGYSFGLHIVFFISKEWRRPDITWYANGERV